MHPECCLWLYWEDPERRILVENARIKYACNVYRFLQTAASTSVHPYSHNAKWLYIRTNFKNLQTTYGV